MTYRQSDSSSKDGYSKPQSRLNQQIRCDSTDEGCPVMEESGTVCGETNSLGIFQEFRQMYDECLKKLEGSQDGSATLRKLAPFKKLIDDLWEQNTMLVETVEELEQEATCRVTDLQDRLNKSCQKELHCMLKAKEREIECLMNKVSEKDELLRKYICQIEDLKKDLKNKCKKYQEILRQLKAVKNEGNRGCEEDPEEDSCDCDDIGELLSTIVKNIEDQKKSTVYQLQNAESQIKALAAENKIYLKERNEIANQLQCSRLENDRLLKEITSQKKCDYEKEELLKTIDVLNSEKKELLEKINTLHENIQELNNNYKETRWALTSEVAEKHDQVQELKRCVGLFEEQLRQADMQTHFKDDIIKELRKELKASKMSLSCLESPTKIPPRENSPPQLIGFKPLNVSTPPKKNKDDELKVDIHIFPINETKSNKTDQIEGEKCLNFHSVEVQTEPSRSPSASNMRNVSTQHKTRVQKLPRSFGTLTVTPWSGAAGEITSDDNSLLEIKEAKKNLKGIYTERRGLYDIVNELREQKNQSEKNVKFSDMNKYNSSVSCSDTGCCAATSISERQDAHDDKERTYENDKFLSQMQCLKKSLKMRVQELKDQEEFTRDLEEELRKTKMDLTDLQKKYERQEQPCRSTGESSVVESDFKRHHDTLISAINKIEETLQNLSVKNSCGLPNFKTMMETEMEKIRSVKNDLEKYKSKIELNKCSEKNSKESQSCSNSENKYHSDSELPNNHCNLIHLDDIEKFREGSICGVVALEQMKEQINILGDLIKKYVEEFPCDCDKIIVEECENKLDKLRTEFDEITDQLCIIIQKVNKLYPGESNENLSFDDTIISREEESVNTQNSYSLEEICRLKSEYQKFQKQVCDQENASEKLKRMSKQLEEEIQQKRNQLIEYAREIDSKMCEISKLRELIRKVCRRLKEMQCDRSVTFDQDSGLPATKRFSNLSGLFCDLQEFCCVLEKSMVTLFDVPKKLREDNEKLKEKLGCLEKCVCNKDETLRFLQDTVKLRECQIEEFKSRMQTSENQSSKLAQDIEDKCRLIANLQEAVRKCKQFEVNMEVFESLRFEYCELECKLEMLEKEILLKDQKLKSLYKEITNLSSKNSLLTEKLKIIDPKLKIMYKTCHLFEKTVRELQEELNNKECEIEGLYGKIKDLETELETEFRKCEERAAEDSKCIEELSLTIKKFQTELYCAKESYNNSIIDTENRLKKEMEMRETGFNKTICQLESEIIRLQTEVQENVSKSKSSVKMADLESVIRQAKSQQENYEKSIMELQRTLKTIAEEHGKEKNDIWQKLCDEKKENLKNKNMITELNENMKRKLLHERSLRECLDKYTEDIENLKAENEDLKTEVEARKKIMCAIEKEEAANLTELEELICSLKIQKAELKTKYCNLKAEMDKEIKLKRLLECRVEDLSLTLQNKTQEFNQMVENYKCASSRIQQTQATMKEIEANLICSQSDLTQGFGSDDVEEYKCLKKLLDIKTAENAKLICQIQVLKVEMEFVQNENAAMQANKDAAISHLQYEIECLENDVQELQTKCQKLNEENERLYSELKCWRDKETSKENEFRERQKDLCGKLRMTICEKNDLLNSLDELQKQLEHIVLENVNKEKKNRELSEECSRLKINNDSCDNYLRNKSDKIICNLSKEVKNLHCELSASKVNYNVLNEEYQALLEQFKCSERKKYNLEKLYEEMNNENKELLESKATYEKELCELRTQNLLLKDKIANKGEGFKNSDDKKKMCQKIKELTAKIKTLEKKIIPDLEQEITEKICCIENLKIELREANISSQRMRNEALKVVQQTRKYLAAQKFANETLKAHLECSNKRGNMLGFENRELEEQLKAVTRMNEFLMRQLTSTKSDMGEVEPRSFSPLPWGCSTAERDTSSSEYLAESGFQSMQPSPTNFDSVHESQYDFKRNNSSQWSSLKKYKYGGSVDYALCRNGLR